MATAVLKCDKCQIVINELLCFLQNKLDIADHESLMRIVLSAFNTEDIHVAKDLLFESLPSTSQRKISRRKNKEQKDLEDILHIFKTVDPDLIPVFVARELQRLPPVTFDHVDVTKLLKDIQLLKSEITDVKEHYITKEQVITIVKTETEHLRFASMVNAHCNVNNKRGAYVLDSGPVGLSHVSLTDCYYNTTAERPVHETGASTPVSARPSEPIFTEPARIPVPVSHQPEAHYVNVGKPTATSSPPVVVPLSQQAPRSVSFTHQPQPPVVSKSGRPNGDRMRPATPKANKLKPSTSDNSKTTGVGQLKPVKVSKQSLAEIVSSGGEWKLAQKDGEWTEYQRKRLRNRIDQGNQKKISQRNFKFKAADKKIPLFISNVHKDTTDRDIIKYISFQTNEQISLHKINMKQERGHDAYKIFVAEDKAQMFLKHSFWPAGITCRQFVRYTKPNTPRGL